VWNKLLKFATLRPRSEKEIRDWLKRKKVSSADQKKYIKNLKKLEFLSDIKFANWWITQSILSP
jgi:SOS response regulatory protein OraA/RecX